MSSSDTEVKRSTLKLDMSEKELMQNVITNLLEILCSSFEYITEEQLSALRAARENYVDRELNMEALLTEISLVKEDCIERMNRVKRAETELRKAIEDIQKELGHWPTFVKSDLSLVCNDKQKLLRSIADQHHRAHSKSEVDNACTRICSFLDYERQMLTKYFTYMKNHAKSKSLDYSTFVKKPTVLDSIVTDRPIHMHNKEQMADLAERTTTFDVFLPEECNRYLCPFQHQPHFHECKLSDCRLYHIYPCFNRECKQPHCHTSRASNISSTCSLENLQSSLDQLYQTSKQLQNLPKLSRHIQSSLDRFRNTGDLSEITELYQTSRDLQGLSDVCDISSTCMMIRSSLDQELQNVSKHCSPCDSKHCNKHPSLLKFGDSLCFQRVVIYLRISKDANNFIKLTRKQSHLF